MLKSRFYRIIVLVFSVFLGAENISFAQTQFLEFKFGAAASSPSNGDVPELGADVFQRGLAIAAGYGYEFPCELFRVYAGLGYTGKGEKYPMESLDAGFNSYMSYFCLNTDFRVYFLGGLFYFAAGGYSGYCFRSEITSGDLLDQRGNLRFIEYYKNFDLGPKTALGMEIGLSNVRCCIELSYEHGLKNISNRSVRKITNRCLLLTVGADFKILGKGFRHY
jgi:hypothetical protein